MDEAALERALFAREVPPPIARRPLPDWATVAHEKKRKGVTLQLLWEEYRAAEPQGYGYSQFAEHYRRWRTTIDRVMRQEYRAGERCFVDYAGLTMDVVDPTTGEARPAQIFVGALGTSNYTYTEATQERDYELCDEGKWPTTLRELELGTQAALGPERTR